MSPGEPDAKKVYHIRTKSGAVVSHYLLKFYVAPHAFLHALLPYLKCMSVVTRRIYSTGSNFETLA